MLIQNKIYQCLYVVVATLLLQFNANNFNLKAQESTRENTIAIATMGEPASLDVHYANGGEWEHTIYQDIYSGLFEKDKFGKAIPAVVKSYNVSKDGKVYTFYLKQTTWSDGTPLTAHDFVFSYARILSPEVASEYSFFLYQIKNAQAYNGGKVAPDQLGVKALDDYTLQITLEYPASYFISSLTHYAYFPVPKHKVEKLGKAWSKPENMVSNGAYRITQWKANSFLKAVQNDKFWDNANTKIPNIIYYTQEDRGAVLKRFRAGEVDIAGAFDSAQYEWLKTNLPKEIKNYPYNATTFITINVIGKNKALLNSNVRQALALAVDREFITNNILKTGEVPAYSFVPAGLEKYKPVEYSWKNLNKEQRKAKAKELLKTAGFDENNPLKIEFSHPSSEGAKKLYIALADMFKEYNIQLIANVKDVSNHYAELQKHNYELAYAGWVGDYDEASTYLDLFKGGIGQNYGGYNNPKYDETLEKAKSSLDETQRNKLYAQNESTILNENLVIPLYYPVSKSLVNQRVLGYENNAGNHHQARFFSFK